MNSCAHRSVELIEATCLLPGMSFFSEVVSDEATKRQEWFALLQNKVAQSIDFVFFDPDNGLEVKSRPYGRKNSSKFLYWHEVQSIWNQGKSILIYQHFIREKRNRYIQRMLAALKTNTPESSVEAFATPNVVFLMALQPTDRKHLSSIRQKVEQRWGDQIRSVLQFDSLR